MQFRSSSTGQLVSHLRYQVRLYQFEEPLEACAPNHHLMPFRLTTQIGLQRKLFRERLRQPRDLALREALRVKNHGFGVAVFDRTVVHKPVR